MHNADINVLLGLDPRVFYSIRGHPGATINMRETPGTSGGLGTPASNDVKLFEILMISKCKAVAVV